MLNCAEQAQIQKYKTHTYKTPKTAYVQTIMLQHQLSSKYGYKQIVYPYNANIDSMYTISTPRFKSLVGLDPDKAQGGKRG